MRRNMCERNKVEWKARQCTDYLKIAHYRRVVLCLSFGACPGYGEPNNTPTDDPAPTGASIP